MATATKINAPTSAGNASLDTPYRRLKKENPDVSGKELRRIDALLSLYRVKGTVAENTITMSAIEEEVNDVRAER